MDHNSIKTYNIKQNSTTNEIKVVMAPIQNKSVIKYESDLKTPLQASKDLFAMGSPKSVPYIEQQSRYISGNNIEVPWTDHRVQQAYFDFLGLYNLPNESDTVTINKLGIVLGINRKGTYYPVKKLLNEKHLEDLSIYEYNFQNFFQKKSNCNIF